MQKTFHKFLKTLETIPTKGFETKITKSFYKIMKNNKTFFNPLGKSITTFI